MEDDCVLSECGVDEEASLHVLISTVECPTWLPALVNEAGVLDGSRGRLSKPQLRELFTYLGYNGSEVVVKALNLSNCMIDNEACQWIRECLKTNTTVTEFDPWR